MGGGCRISYTPPNFSRLHIAKLFSDFETFWVSIFYCSKHFLKKSWKSVKNFFIYGWFLKGGCHCFKYSPNILSTFCKKITLSALLLWISIGSLKIFQWTQKYSPIYKIGWIFIIFHNFLKIEIFCRFERALEFLCDLRNFDDFRILIIS